MSSGVPTSACSSPWRACSPVRLRDRANSSNARFASARRERITTVALVRQSDAPSRTPCANKMLVQYVLIMLPFRPD